VMATAVAVMEGTATVEAVTTIDGMYL